MWIKSKGIFHLEKGIARVHLRRDFESYYLWLLKRKLSHGFKHREFSPAGTADPDFDGSGMGMIQVGAPFGKPHITVARDIYNKKTKWGKMKSYVGAEIPFEYSPIIQLGGWKSDFWNFYLLVRSKEIDFIKTSSGAMEGKKSFLHITIANTKSAQNRKPVIHFDNNA
jgi:hypothetical protein